MDFLTSRPYGGNIDVIANGVDKENHTLSRVRAPVMYWCTIEMYSFEETAYLFFTSLIRYKIRWNTIWLVHDDVIKWKHFPRYWPFVRGIQRSPVNSPHKGQWRGALMFSLICAWINDWVNTREAGDLRRYRAHYDVIVMLSVKNVCSP